MSYDIICQSCAGLLSDQTKDYAMSIGWTLDDDPYMPHWYCPDCSEDRKESEKEDE